jgi:hypothetical protein
MKGIWEMIRVAILGLLIGLCCAQPDITDARKKYDCLPQQVRLDQVVSYGRKPEDNITVAKKLIELKAKCSRKRLVDSKNREIRFFHVHCWGNPPPNYLEIKEKEKADFERLQKDYTVITIGCNPRTG